MCTTRRLRDEPPRTIIGDRIIATVLDRPKLLMNYCKFVTTIAVELLEIASIRSTMQVPTATIGRSSSTSVCVCTHDGEGQTDAKTTVAGRRRLGVTLPPGDGARGHGSSCTVPARTARLRARPSAAPGQRPRLVATSCARPGGVGAFPRSGVAATKPQAPRAE